MKEKNSYFSDLPNVKYVLIHKLGYLESKEKHTIDYSIYYTSNSGGAQCYLSTKNLDDFVKRYELRLDIGNAQEIIEIESKKGVVH